MTGFIGKFDGPHDWLSNFHRSPVHLDGHVYPTVEHAFQAMKTTDPAERDHVRNAPDPGEAKRRGLRVTLRPGWDEIVRHQVMADCIAAKFTDPGLRAALSGTGDDLLVEGNTWHDQTWGDCTCPRHRAVPGNNLLGLALMAHRAVLRGDRSDRWPRAMVTGHRPNRLTQDQASFASAELDRIAVKLAAQHATHVAISGMALGADTLWARSALKADLDLWAYLPFEAQPERWGPSDRNAWALLRAAAAREVILGDRYAVQTLHARNDLMIRDADVVIAVTDPAFTTGGTATTIAKATRAGRPIITVDVAAGRTSILRPPGSAPHMSRP